MWLSLPPTYTHTGTQPGFWAVLLLSGTSFNSENGSALRYGSTLILDSGQFVGLNWLNEARLTVGGNQGYLASFLVPRLDVLVSGEMSPDVRPF